MTSLKRVAAKWCSVFVLQQEKAINLHFLAKDSKNVIQAQNIVNHAELFELEHQHGRKGKPSCHIPFTQAFTELCCIFKEHTLLTTSKFKSYQNASQNVQRKY